jgi:hypothetical protein
VVGPAAFPESAAGDGVELDGDLLDPQGAAGETFTIFRRTCAFVRKKTPPLEVQSIH